GYVGFVLPLTVVLIFIISAKKWKLLKAMNLPLGIFIVLAIALPWYLLMYKLHGGRFLHHILMRETIMRIFYAPNNETGMAFLFGYSKKLFYYVPILIGWFIPHSLFLPAAIIDAFKSKNTYSREKESYKFILSFFFGIFAFFTIISVKEYHYMLPIAPAFALITARYLINLQERGTQFRNAGFNIPYILIIIIYTLGLAAVLYIMNHIYPSKVVFYEYAIILMPLVLIIPYVRRKNSGTLFALPVAIGIAMLFLAGKAIPLLNDNAIRIFAEEIRENLKEEDKVGIGSVDISQQRLGIYLNRHIEEINSKLKTTRDAIPIHRNKIRKFLTSDDSIYLVISQNDYLKLVPNELKSGLVIIDKRETWKTRLKRSFNKGIIMQILRGEKDIIKDVLRHEIYLLTNKEETQI
ncbi:MAG: hypothetical protein U9R52_02365, partial [Candidatus Omnitrophota bacterium]|nr:hypothetical protein [Candidatus Omnitrophota bacterium]